MKSWIFPAAILLAMLTGCGKTVTVSRGPQSTAPPVKNETVDGIPFYVKRAYCQQQASWLEPRYTVSVQATVDGKPAPWLGVSTVLSRSSLNSFFDLPALQAVSGKDLDVKTAEDCESFVATGALVDRLRRETPIGVDETNLQPSLARGDLALIENSAHEVAYVDYQTVYYYNTSWPLTGTSQVDVKLAADGTLTEGSASINDQTLSSITSVLSSAVSGLAAATFPAPVSGGATLQLPEACRKFPGKVLRYNVAVTQQTFKHTHTFKDPAMSEPACAPRALSSIMQCDQACSITVTDVTTPPPPATPDKPPVKPPASGSKPHAENDE